MNRRWLWVALPAMVVLVAVENFLFFAKSSEGLQEVPDDADNVLELEVDAGELREPLEALDESDLVQWLAGIPLDRNPFWRASEGNPAVADEGGNGLRLAGTLVGPTRKVAWIGGAPRSVGDRVADQVIVDIQPDGVVLDRDGDAVFLAIAEPPGDAVLGLDPEENVDDAELD